MSALAGTFQQHSTAFRVTLTEAMLVFNLNWLIFRTPCIGERGAQEKYRDKQYERSLHTLLRGLT
jgi:hypothetical protein